MKQRVLAGRKQGQLYIEEGNESIDCSIELEEDVPPVIIPKKRRSKKKKVKKGVMAINIDSRSFTQTPCLATDSSSFMV